MLVSFHCNSLITVNDTDILVCINDTPLLIMTFYMSVSTLMITYSPGSFVPRNESSRGRKFQGTKVPPHGTFVPNCETVGSLSKLGPTKPGPSKPGQVGINS